MNQFPKNKTELWDLYRKQVSCFWTDTEINFKNDINDLKNSNKQEKKLLAFILIFFRDADNLVVSNIIDNFIENFEETEIKFNYSFQIVMENIHQLVYNDAINTYIDSNEEFAEIVKSTEILVKTKLEWIKYLKDTELNISKRVLYFICIEGILFASSFASIFWFKNKNILESLTTSNEFISRDEGLHTKFGCLLYLNYCDKCTREEIVEIFKKCVDLEISIIKSFEFNILTLSTENLIKYVKYIADYTLSMINEQPIYGEENPFSFINPISLDLKTNFFEKRVTNYQHKKKNISHDVIKNFF